MNALPPKSHFEPVQHRTPSDDLNEQTFFHPEKFPSELSLQAHHHLSFADSMSLAETSQYNLAIWNSDAFWRSRLKPECQPKSDTPFKQWFKENPEDRPDVLVPIDKTGKKFLKSHHKMHLGPVKLRDIREGKLTIKEVEEDWLAFSLFFDDIHEELNFIVGVTFSHLTETDIQSIINRLTPVIKKYVFDRTDRTLKEWADLWTTSFCKRLNHHKILEWYLDKGWLSIKQVNELTDAEIANLNAKGVQKLVHRKKLNMEQALSLSPRVVMRLEYWKIRELFSANLISVCQLESLNDQQFIRLILLYDFLKHEALSVTEATDLMMSVTYLDSLGSERKSLKTNVPLNKRSIMVTF